MIPEIRPSRGGPTTNPGTFPRVPSGTVVSLMPGNGSCFRVGVIWVLNREDVEDCGVHISVEGRGAYTFVIRADAGYVQHKLCVLPGDATHLADFINDQLFKRQGSYQ
jgi:hypothetical protein